MRLGVVGAGIMGGHHGRVISRLHGVELTVVVDADVERAKALASTSGALASAELDALEGVDGVILAVPSPLHGDLGEELLDRGHDLLVEKPLATTVAEARRLVDAAERNGRILMVGHVERFNPGVIELATHVENLLHIEITRVGPYSSRVIGDVLLDLMIHDVDLARSLAGSEIVSHHAVSRVVRSGSEDFASALLVFGNGVTATLTVSRVSQNKVRRIVLTQQDNSVVADLLRQQVEIHRIEHSEYLSEGGARYRQSGFVEIPFLATSGEPLALEIQHFVDCIAERGAPLVSGHDGLVALETCIAIRESAISALRTEN